MFVRLPPLFRRFGAAFALWSAPALGAAPPAVDNALAAADLPLPTWELTGNLRTAFGYKENLLLSAVHREDSAFAQAEGEVFWWRLPTARFEALAFANAALTRYFSSEENPREWQAFAHAEARWFAGERARLEAIVEGYHLDQVFDLSASDAERLTARLAVTGGLVTTPLRWEFHPGTWLELKPTLQRDRYRDGSDDNRQQVARVLLGRRLAAGRAELAVSGQLLRRDYERRPQYTAAGRPVAGSGLEFAQREGEARLTIAWDRAQRWSTTTAATLTDNTDNGTGYFDYRHRALRQEIAWTRAPWKARLTARAGRYDYDVQTVGIGINPPARLKEEFLLQARIERQWTERTRLYADYTWERSRSNDPLASYRVRTALAGIDWAF